MCIVGPTIDLEVPSFWYTLRLEPSTFANMLNLLLIVYLLVGSTLSISDELAAELGYPAGVDVW